MFGVFFYQFNYLDLFRGVMKLFILNLRRSVLGITKYIQTHFRLCLAKMAALRVTFYIVMAEPVII